MTDFHLAKSYLQQTDSKGQTLYDHITSLILKLLKDKPEPDVALKELEEMSVKLKQNFQSKKVVGEVREENLVESEERTKLLSYLQFTINSLKDQTQTPESSVEVEPEVQQTRVQDLRELSELFQYAGIVLTSNNNQDGTDVVKLHLSIARLVESQAAAEATRAKQPGQGSLALATARFWGVVRGTEKDYYIVEATRARYPLVSQKSRIINAAEIAAQKLKRKQARDAIQEEKKRLQAAADAAEAAGEEPQEVLTPRAPVGVLKEKRIKPIYEKTESAGSGANEWIYFVSNSLEVGTKGSEWTLLPDLDNKLVETTKSLRRLMTGNLSSPVLGGYPKFSGKEADYLRVQIARISSSTLISPVGYHTVEQVVDESDPNVTKEVVVPDVEYATPQNVSDLVTSAGWSHHRSYLLKQGRVSVWEEPEQEEDEEDQEEEEEEEEEVPQQEEEVDEPLPLLSSIEEDTSKGLSTLWSFRCTPNKVEHPHASVLARSLLWPGAYAVARRERAECVYVGDAQKYCPEGFTPARPPIIQREYQPRFNAEEDEPNPMQEQMDPLPPPEEEKREDGDEEDGEEDQGDDGQEEDE